MKNKIINIIEIVLLTLTFPLWFIKLFVDVGYLPNEETGGIVKCFFYHSMYENICALDIQFIVNIFMIVTFISIIVLVLNFIFYNKKMNIICHIVFGIIILIFIILLIIASTVARGY